MHETWRSFLEACGAVLVNDEAAHFGDPDAEAAAAAEGESLADLSHLGALHVTGDDARAFLHGQLTNDVQGLSDSRSELAGYCNPKGRLLAVMRLVAWRGGMLLLLPRALVEPIMSRLRMYVLRARVVLAPAEALVMVGASGAQAPRLLRGAGLDPPETVDGCTRSAQMSVLRVPGTAPRFILLGAPETLQHSWTALQRGARPVGAGRWRWQELRAGLPSIVPETVEQFVPQMVNLDLVGGVNFKKGCYPGQEIVARMHYRAKTRQRMALMHADAAAAPAGTAVFEHGGGDQPAGQVVNAEPAPGGGIDALVSSQVGRLQSVDLRLGSPDGTSLRPGHLPYPLADG